MEEKACALHLINAPVQMLQQVNFVNLTFVLDCQEIVQVFVEAEEIALDSIHALAILDIMELSASSNLVSLPFHQFQQGENPLLKDFALNSINLSCKLAGLPCCD